MSETNVRALADPFPPEDVEWRVGRAGKKNGRIWAKVLAYITNRAIMERLDDVCGPENWRNDYREGPGGGVLCGIGVRVNGDWVWKWDGAENTEIESVKGGLSGSMKRAAVQWGIGRYLYNLDEGWADVHDEGQYYGRLPQDKGGDAFHWDPPPLPEWAKPGGKGKPTGPTEFNRQTGEIEDEPDAPDPVLPDELQDLLNRAAELGAVDVEKSARVEAAIEEADPDKMRLAYDWLQTQMEKAKMGGTPEKAPA